MRSEENFRNFRKRLRKKFSNSFFEKLFRRKIIYFISTGAKPPPTEGRTLSWFFREIIYMIVTVGDLKLFCRWISSFLKNNIIKYHHFLMIFRVSGFYSRCLHKWFYRNIFSDFLLPNLQKKYHHFLKK